MNHEIFNLHINWLNRSLALKIKTERANGSSPVIALYEVFSNHTYLFSVFPTFTPGGEITWKMVEIEREIELPPGFIGFLGSNIEDVYAIN